MSAGTVPLPPQSTAKAAATVARVVKLHAAAGAYRKADEHTMAAKCDAMRVELAGELTAPEMRAAFEEAIRLLAYQLRYRVCDCGDVVADAVVCRRCECRPEVPAEIADAVVLDGQRANGSTS